MVWNTLLLLFQALLLAGYFYAWVWKAVPLKIAALGQVGLIALCGLFFLPLNVDAVEHVKAAAPWVSTVVYGVTVVGVPFLFLSTTVSMIQRLEVIHFPDKEPYSLYAFSNAGSLMGLLAYPLMFEPYYTTHEQVAMWGLGAFVWGAGFMVLLSWTGVSSKKSDVELNTEMNAVGHPTWKQLGYWALLAFIPSSLMHGVTFYITSDIAAFPMFWILPLGIFLLTYIVAFGGFKVKDWDIFSKSIRGLVLFVFFLMMTQKAASLGEIALHLLLYFFIALYVHALLYKARPEKHHLESYYLAIALGGVVGGIFHVIIAPLFFTNWMWEYPLSLAIALIVGPMPQVFKNVSQKKQIFIAVFIAFAMVASWYGGMQKPLAIIYILFFIYGVLFFGKRYLFPAVLTLSLIGVVLQYNYLHTDRSFYGFYRVYDHKAENVRYFSHGSTTHGIQSLDNKRTGWSYYKPAYAAFEILDPTYTQLDIAMIGLGTGGMVDFYGNVGRQVDVYEIDPTVYDIAYNTGLFTYLKNAEDLGVNINLKLGDGRLNLAESNKKYDVILLDAFSSDSVPIHMLTVEALKLYADSLKETGIVMYNVSNRHFDFTPLLFKQAYEIGLEPARRHLPSDREKLIYSSNWFAASHNKDLIMSMKENYEWESMEQDDVDAAPLWSDEKNSALKVMRALKKASK